MGIEEEIIEELAAELEIEDPQFNVSLLISKVRNAVREVKKARRYPKYYTEEQIEEDVASYYTNIRSIALYDYNQTGVEFQNSHSESGISRNYVDRNKLFSGIIPLARC